MQGLVYYADQKEKGLVQFGQEGNVAIIRIMDKNGNYYDLLVQGNIVSLLKNGHILYQDYDALAAKIVLDLVKVLSSLTKAYEQSMQKLVREICETLRKESTKEKLQKLAQWLSSKGIMPSLIAVPLPTNVGLWTLPIPLNILNLGEQGKTGEESSSGGEEESGENPFERLFKS